MAGTLFLPSLRPDQWRIATHPAKVKVVANGRRWGKTVMAGATALSTAAAGGRVAWVVPTYRNGRPLWRWAEAACAPLVRRDLVRLNRAERTIEFPESDGFLGIYSDDNDAGIRGEWFNLAILEEAAQIAEATWTDVVQPTLADADGDAIIISTPKGKNWFWREWQRGLSQMDGEIAAFTAPTSDNPSPSIRQAAALARERVPDATYRQEWLAEFVAEAHELLSRDWFATRRFDATPGATPPLRILDRYLSWDTAFKDSDTAAYSACVVGELFEPPGAPVGTRELRIIDVWRDRVSFPNLIDHMRRLRRIHNADGRLRAELIEDKASGTSAYQTLETIHDPHDPVRVVPFQPSGSKDQRAAQAGVLCKLGTVWLPAGSRHVPWLTAFEDEIFEQGRHFDQRDAFAQLVIYLEPQLRDSYQYVRGASPREGAL